MQNRIQWMLQRLSAAFALILIHMQRQAGLIAVHKARHVRFIGRIAAQHPMPAQQPDIAGLNERRYLFRVNIAVVVLYVLIVDLAEQIVDFRRVKAGRVHVIAAELQIVEQIRQGNRLPLADRLIERDVQRFFFLRVVPSVRAAAVPRARKRAISV